jgi:hypothetical protein
MAGAPLNNLRMFIKLCGDDALKHVILATTMWSRVKSDIAERRETELQQKYWSPMLQLGSQCGRFDDTFSSAWDIIDSIVKHTGGKPHAVLLQMELVDLRRRLKDTQAGMALYEGLQKSLIEQRETIRKIREDISLQNNEKAMQELTTQYEQIQETLEKTFGQCEKMKVSGSLGMHLKLWLTFGKTLQVIILLEIDVNSLLNFFSAPRLLDGADYGADSGVIKGPGYDSVALAVAIQDMLNYSSWGSEAFIMASTCHFCANRVANDI